MVNPQIVAWVAVVLGVAAMACFIRLWALGLVSTYPSLSWFFVVQAVTTALSSFLGQATGLYQWLYPGFLMAEWVVYVFVVREIYNSIFSEFPGIAILGKVSVYVALIVTAFVAAFSIAGAQQQAHKAHFMLLNLETAAHCFTFGFAILLATILVTISRYPLHLHKNILFNATFFGGVLIGEAAGLLLDQLTARHYTFAVNIAVSLNTSFWFLLWIFLLSREGQTQLVNVPGPFEAGEEARLLGQLGAINALFLRAIRR